MAEPTTDEVLTFMIKYKTRKQLEEKFGLSNTQSYHLIRWLIKSRHIEEICMRETGRTNRVWYYKTIQT